MRGRAPSATPDKHDITLPRRVKILVQRNEFGKVIRPQPSVEYVTRLIEELLHQELGHLIEEDHAGMHETYAQTIDRPRR